MTIISTLLYMLGEMAPYILFGLLIAGILQAFVPEQTMSRHLSKPGIKSVIKAAILGIPLPLCSCGVLPTAVALRRAGASKGATTSFLIATPQTGVDSIAATYSLLGPAFAIVRPIAALVTALVGGCAVSADEKKDTDKESKVAVASCPLPLPEEGHLSFAGKCVAAVKYGFYDMVKSIGGWLVIGLVIAALITIFVPTEIFTSLAHYPLLAMLAVVIVAVPMYVCATGSIPIAMSLMLKGLSPGTALVLLMAGPAANFASITIISKNMGKRTAAIYLLCIVVGAIAFGLGIDYLLPREWFTHPIGNIAEMKHCHLSWLQWVCSGILLLLLAVALIPIYLSRITNKQKTKTDNMKVYHIEGMNCAHCQASVQRGLSRIPGVTKVEVSLANKTATVEGEHDPKAVADTIDMLGFELKD